MTSRRNYDDLDRHDLGVALKGSSPRGYPRDDRHERSRSGSRGGSRQHRGGRSMSRSPPRKKYGSSGTSKRSYRSRSHDGAVGGRSHGGGGRGRSRSKSPMSSRRRHNNGSRVIPENPGPNKCIGVFGLSLRTTERDLRDVFSRYGPIEECTVVIDAQTGRSRGFSFIYFESIEDAKSAKESCNGIEIDGRRIRVDFSITQRAHTPTPGIYMGSMDGKGRGGDRRGGGGNFRRGGGGGYRDDRGRDDRRYDRGDRGSYRSPPQRRRSRSYSPRKYY